MKRSIIAWLLFAAFAVAAVAMNWHPQILDISGKAGVIKLVVWLVFFAFVAYSYHSSTRENLFRTIRTMNSLYWGRQIGIDLYIGASLFLCFVYLHEGSILALAFWLIPILLFVNLATLLYVAIHFESILAWFVY